MTQWGHKAANVQCRCKMQYWRKPAAHSKHSSLPVAECEEDSVVTDSAYPWQGRKPVTGNCGFLSGGAGLMQPVVSEGPGLLQPEHLI